MTLLEDFAGCIAAMTLTQGIVLAGGFLGTAVVAQHIMTHWLTITWILGFGVALLAVHSLDGNGMAQALALCIAAILTGFMILAQYGWVRVEVKKQVKRRSAASTKSHA